MVSRLPRVPRIIALSYPWLENGMIIVKPGVIFKNLRPEIYKLFGLLDNTWAAYGATCVITSGNDGVHKIGSFHYKDLAIDLRSKNLPSDRIKEGVLGKLRHKLGKNYDVFWEYPGQPNEHFHIEYDPKTE